MSRNGIRRVATRLLATRARWVSVFVALSVLAWAATVGAECAWVLWNESGHLGAPPSWKLVYAASSENDCRIHAKQDYAEATAELRGFRERGHQDLTIVYDDARLAFGTSGRDGMFRSKFYCLPVTMDPREPTRK